MPVAQNLELDVSRPLDELLHINVGAAERLLGLRTRRPEQWNEFLGRADDPHPAAAAALGRLDHHRVADLARYILRGIFIRHHARAAAMASFALSFSPISRIASGVGPIKVMCDASQTSAKLAFSERKP